MLNDYEIYEFLKMMNPKNTQLKIDILDIIDGVDPSFRRRHSDFFYTNDLLTDRYSNDGIIDWLIGYRYAMYLRMTKKERKIVDEIIQEIERNKI